MTRGVENCQSTSGCGLAAHPPSQTSIPHRIPTHSRAPGDLCDQIAPGKSGHRRAAGRFWLLLREGVSVVEACAKNKEMQGDFSQA